MNTKHVFDLLFHNIPLDKESLWTEVGVLKYGCYALYCAATEKLYVGSSIDCRHRRGVHFAKLSKGKHPHIEMQRDFDAYGREAFLFFIIERCAFTDMCEAESQWWHLAKNRGRLYSNGRAFHRRPILEYEKRIQLAL